MKQCKDCGYTDNDIHFEHEREVFENETDLYDSCPICNSENIIDVKEVLPQQQPNR